MRVVGIDSSGSTASVALIEDGELIAERIHPDCKTVRHAGLAGAKSNHAEVLLPLIEAVLTEARLPFSELSGLALTIGPGSFTGLRIGLSTVKGLAYGWDIPVAGFSTLLAQAERVDGFDGLVCSCLDARKNELYAALFRKIDHGLTRLTEDFLAPVEESMARIRSISGAAPCLFIGDAMQRYEKKLLDGFGPGARLNGAESVSSCAAAVARLGMVRLGNAECDDPGNLAPLYLRPSEAEVKRGNRF